MARTTKANTYLRIRRWVDRDLVAHYRPLSPFLGLLPVIILAPIWRILEGPAAWVSGTLAISLSVIWTGFVLWRVARLYKAVGVKGDRAYDQRGKYLLAPEYHRSESVTAAAQRKRSQRRRSPRR